MTPAGNGTSVVQVEQKPTWGAASTFSLISAVATGAGAVVAAVKSNDTVAAGAGAYSVIMALGLVGGRVAQAIAYARIAARWAKPLVDELAEDPAAK